MKVFFYKHLIAFLLLPIIFFFFLYLITNPVYAVEKGETTIKVVYPIQAGLTDLNENGDFSGYYYEYLQEIAQYTGWNYEFIVLDQENLNDALLQGLELLKSGEADLMCGFNYTEELTNIYDYTTESFGCGYTVLSVLDKNTDINEFNYATKKNLKIGIISKSTKKIQNLKLHCETNNVDASYFYYENEAALTSALLTGEIDASLNIDLSAPDFLRTIATISAQPFYVAVTKGKTEISEKLDMAIRKINEVDPYFSSHIYDQYFGTEEQVRPLFLTEEEKIYIENTPSLKVAIIENQKPIQYIDADEKKYTGIAVDIIQLISDKTGLNFEYVFAQDQEEAASLLKNGQADLIAAMRYDYDLANFYNIALTRPYLSAPIILAINPMVNTDNLSEKKLVLPKDSTLFNPYSPIYESYPDMKSCLDAVNKSKADYSYGNAYLVQYSANMSSYRNIILVPQTNLAEKISFGIAKPTDIELLTILNKAIVSISDSKLQSIIYHNTIENDHNITLSNYIDANLKQVLFIFVLVSLIIIVSLAYFLYNRIQVNRKIAIDKERYEQLSEVSNEYLFEYDVARDRLLLTEKSAQFFGCPRNITQFSVLAKIPTLDRTSPTVFHQIYFSDSETQETYCKLPNGRMQWLRITSKSILSPLGEKCFLLGKLTDIQKEQEEKKFLLETSQKDSLTQIYNSATSKKQIIAMLNSDHSKGTLFILDIDHFKDINDKYGHYNGDYVLTEIASILKQSFLKRDIVGRLGGDEFIIFMKDVLDKKVIENKCVLLKKRVDEIIIDGRSNFITISIGAVVTKKGLSFEDLYKLSDQILYQVKNKGRNGYKIFDPSTDKF